MPFEIDTTGIEACLRDLAAAAGHGSNTEQALYVVAGKVLDTAIALTPMSNEEGLIERVNRDVNLDFARYDVLGGDGMLTTNQGRRGLPPGTQWLQEISVRTGRTTNYIMRGGSPRRWSNARWARYQATAAQREADLKQSLAIRTRKAVASIGLARQSWSQIADDLGITLHAANLDKIRAAVASDGVRYQNGSGTRAESDEGIALILENSAPALVRGNGASILQRAVNSRLDTFARELESGVLADMTALARRYRGLTIYG